VKWVNELDSCFLLVKGFWKLDVILSSSIKTNAKMKMGKNLLMKIIKHLSYLEWNWHIYKRLCKNHWNFTKANTQSNKSFTFIHCCLFLKNTLWWGYMWKNACKDTIHGTKVLWAIKHKQDQLKHTLGIGILFQPWFGWSMCCLGFILFL
jgi:hypothetical protein